MLFHDRIFAVFITAIWGMNFIVIHWGLKEISPQTLCWIRFFLASTPLIFFVKRPLLSIRVIIIFGLLMFVMQFTFLFSAMKEGMTAGLASLLMQTQIFFTSFLAVIFLEERIDKWQIIATIISFLGIFLVGKHLNTYISLSGFLLTMAAAASWGVANLYTKKINKTNMFSLIVWGSFFAWPPLLLISVISDGSDKIIYSISHMSLLSLFSILYIVYPSTILAFTAWSKLLSKYPATMVVPYTLLVPIFGLLSSAIFLREPLPCWKIIAAVLVISGLCINILAPRVYLRLSVIR